MPGCHTQCPLCNKDMEDCSCLTHPDYEEYWVTAHYGLETESVGEIQLRKLVTSQDHPEYLEIDGVCYYPQH